ncbi:MAG TPA: hypothetical protein DIU15_14210, partial [Deltaproteobacteria bacterium]|nr:hypothetical protein [Deltaproteobacteria bacterium]
LFEHMMFKRTDKYDDNHFSKSLEESGAPDLNAWTWLDITAYHVSLPKTKLGLIVDLESTRMDGLILDKDQLDAEREVVINERRYRVDNDPEGAMNERLWSLAFEKNGYHWPTIGWQADIEGYTVEDCQEFYKQWYAPNNATIVLVGNFDRAEALSLIQTAYKDIPASDIARLEHGDEPEQTEARRLDLELEVESEMLQLGYKVPALTHADYPALAVLDSILTAGNSSRLERRLVDTGLAASAGAFLPPFQNEGLYEFSVTMRSEKAADAALAVVRAELNDLQTTPVTAEELERARNQLLAAMHSRLLSNSGRAGFIGFNEVAAGSWDQGLSRIDAVRQVTAEDVLRVAKTWLGEGQSSLVVARPKGKKLLTFRARDLPKPGVGEVETLPPVLGRPAEGPPPYTEGEVIERESMGWTRLMVYDKSLPMVWFQLVIPFGSGVEPDEKAGLANITAELVLRGTRDRSRDVFERTLEGLGASVGVAVGADTIILSGSVLSENWPAIATLLAEALDDPALKQEDLDQLIDEVRAGLVEDRNNDRWLGRHFLSKGLFVGHPYGRSSEGSSTTLGRITREDVVGFHRRWFSSRGAILALLGDFDAGAGSDLAGLAGKLRGEPEEVALRDEPVAPVGRKVWLVDKPGRTQVQIHLAHLFRRPEGPGFAAAWVANEAFGGHGFSARLMQEVREKRGWSYGAYGGFVHAKDTSSYTIWVFPATADALPCMELVLSMYDRFVQEGITEDELNHARNAIGNGAAFYVDTPSKRLSYEVRKRLSGYDPLALMPLVAEVDLEAANAAASAEFFPGDLFGTVVGTAGQEVPVAEGEPSTTLQAALEKLLGTDVVSVVPYDQE